MTGKNPNRQTRPPVKRVRMIDIALEAGVSRAAVSAVLSGTGKGNIVVGEKTAENIRRIARQLNFHPNHAAQQLAGKRSGMIAVLAKAFWQTEQRSLGWLNRTASDRGLKILAWQLQALPEKLDAFVEECVGWNVDGLIYIAYRHDAVWPLVAQALQRYPRVVSILGNPGIPGGHAVEVDAADGVRQSVAHLHRQGRRRIVQLLEGLDAAMDRQQHEAFLAAHREFYGAADESQVCFATAGWGIEDYAKYEELARELVVDRGADAILAESDFSAPGLVRGLTRMGLRLPDDVALVGWGYESVGRGVTPGLTTVDFDFAEIVGRALDLLTGLIERPEEPQPPSILVKPKLLVRETA